MAEEDIRASGTPFSLSFSGSGFLVLYQVGVVQSLLELAPELLRSACKVYGSSAGSLIAAAVVCGTNLDDLKEFFFASAKEVRKTILGPLSPRCSLLANIKAVLQRMLPENSHQVASGRLHISLTRVVDGQNVMVSEFSSKEELIQALLCSCFLPIYCGFIPPSYRGVRYIDGGFTGLQPVSSLEEAVITVSPFTGELDICPRDCPAIFFCFQIFNGSIQISIENLCRISYALFPPKSTVLDDLFFQGYQDTALFLYRNGLAWWRKQQFGLQDPLSKVLLQPYKLPVKMSAFVRKGLQKLWGLLEETNSMIKRFQKLLQNMVPGLPKRAAARSHEKTEMLLPWRRAPSYLSVAVWFNKRVCIPSMDDLMFVNNVADQLLAWEKLSLIPTLQTKPKSKGNTPHNPNFAHSPRNTVSLSKSLCSSD
ncbi:omega-hydroxyceramide transacylase isoform X2 [Struthio camelus]|uniref:omega-hydroxyceramide transacylase isoform X2 n=1 Tax=Struthio camelus TaxID=8801 RepID=UPI003603EE65